MPYATNAGVRIYYEREGSGPPLVLHEGFSLSHQDWRDWGYVDDLNGHYDLLLLDPRGHGASDKPHDPAAYTYEQRVADVAAVLDDAGIERAVFWGYSMGGGVGYAAAHYAPARFRAFIIGGAAPSAGNPENARAAAEALRTGGTAGQVADWGRQGIVLAPALRRRLLANDSEALAAGTIAMGARPSFAASLARLRVPMLIYVGDADQPTHDVAQRAAAGCPQVTFVSLPGRNHVTAVRAAAPHVLAFLAGLAEAMPAQGEARTLRAAVGANMCPTSYGEVCLLLVISRCREGFLLHGADRGYWRPRALRPTATCD